MKVQLILIVGGLVGGLVARTAVAAKPAPPPNCGTDVHVTTTVAGTATAPGDYAIVGDGGSFVTGGPRNSKIESRFQIGNCSHDYTLNLISSTRRLTALFGSGLTMKVDFFNLDRVASVPVTAGNEAALDAWCQTVLTRDANGRVVRDPASGYMLDNYGGCGVDEHGRYVRRAAVFVPSDGSNINYRFHIQASPQDNNAGPCVDFPAICESSYVRVYHPDVSTWVVRFKERNATEGNGGILHGGNLVSEEWAPFEITATNP